MYMGCNKREEHSFQYILSDNHEKDKFESA